MCVCVVFVCVRIGVCVCVCIGVWVRACVHSVHVHRQILDPSVIGKDVEVPALSLCLFFRFSSHVST